MAKIIFIKDEYQNDVPTLSMRQVTEQKPEWELYFKRSEWIGGSSKDDLRPFRIVLSNDEMQELLLAHEMLSSLAAFKLPPGF